MKAISVLCKFLGNHASASETPAKEEEEEEEEKSSITGQANNL